jgi:hypothetical protein
MIQSVLLRRDTTVFLQSVAKAQVLLSLLIRQQWISKNEKQNRLWDY